MSHSKAEKPKPSDEEKPEVKEAESIKLPEFPKPETYRSWKTATREAIRAASDQPDEVFKWVLEVYDKTTKLLAALTKIAKGELARQVLNFKETEANAGRAVRGRQVLFMFNQHVRTNEELGALYRGSFEGQAFRRRSGDL